MSGSLVEMVRAARSATFVDEDGDEYVLEFLPPLSAGEIDAFAASLPCPLPQDLRRLLAETRGFEGGVLERVDLTGQSIPFRQEVLFPHGVPLASDGFGNYWVVDLVEGSTTWGPIYFVRHDPPVLLYQSDSLAEFLQEVFRACESLEGSLLDEVHEDRLYNVWKTNPGVMSYAQCQESADAEIQKFIRGLDASWSVIDLRNASPGMGFCWGRYGPRTELKRHGKLPLFAYRRRRGFFRRLFGR